MPVGRAALCCGAAWNSISLTSIRRRSRPAKKYLKGKVMLLSIIRFLRSWKRYNASLRELYQLGDRELGDIGITRSDIPRVAWDNADR
jgi:uncharacterized protein YjiS (DUF1127 family)